MNCNGQGSFNVPRVLTPLILMLFAGCSLDMTLDATHDGNDGGVWGQPSSQEVAVRFVNATLNEAVNVDFYATNGPVSELPDDLFVEDNLVTASIGVAGTGWIEPGKVDQITYECTADLTIGTSGGTFVDDETGEQHGNGETRWVQQGALALCGGTVTFTFSGDGETFDTRLTIE